jgi:hypothetical protein
MARCLRSLVLGIMAGLGLLLPLQQGEAYVVTPTLTQTPVTGRLADGGTFQGRLTIQTLTVDEDGQLAATGVLTGTALPAAGRATKVPPRPFTAPAALLDLRGTCTTLVLDLAPIVVAPLAQEITLVPVILGPREAPQEDRLLQTTLCTVARLQE